MTAIMAIAMCMHGGVTIQFVYFPSETAQLTYVYVCRKVTFIKKWGAKRSGQAKIMNKDTNLTSDL